MILTAKHMATPFPSSRGFPHLIAICPEIIPAKITLHERYTVRVFPIKVDMGQTHRILGINKNLEPKRIVSYIKALTITQPNSI